MVDIGVYLDPSRRGPRERNAPAGTPADEYLLRHVGAIRVRQSTTCSYPFRILAAEPLVVHPKKLYARGLIRPTLTLE